MHGQLPAEPGQRPPFVRRCPREHQSEAVVPRGGGMAHLEDPAAPASVTASIKGCSAPTGAA